MDKLKKYLNDLKKILKREWIKLNKKEVSNALLAINPIMIIILKNTLNTLELIVLMVCIFTLSILFHIFSIVENKKTNMPLPNRNFVNVSGNKLSMDECDIYPLMVYFNELYRYLEKEGLINGKQIK